MSNAERIVELAEKVSYLTESKMSQIHAITGSVRMLALNALIEAHRAGDHGRGFAVVASEVKSISQAISSVANELQQELVGSASDLSSLGRGLVEHVRGTRLADLALNMIEIIDRNLYERSCDVRWWATDSAVVDAVQQPSAATSRRASQRLGVILSSYTVYLDLWVIDADGRVVANGRPDRYPGVLGRSVQQARWFTQAMATRDGGDFIVDDVCASDLLGGAQVATYATAIRQDGEVDGAPQGVLAIFFDWEPQARAVVQGVRLSEEEKSSTRCLLVDSTGLVIASSDNKGVLSERVGLPASKQAIGHTVRHDSAVMGYALTPGYETYRGLGWYGVIVQTPHSSNN
ncbi:methyl-accepting chemotaxis protein [Insolitispirillum peregrinum]